MVCGGEVLRTPSNGRYPKTCSRECRLIHMRQVNPAYRKRPIPTEKLCTRCGEVKPFTAENFPPSRQRHIGGLYPYCRPCNRAKREKWGQDYPGREWLSERVDRFKRSAAERGSPVVKFTTADFMRLYRQQDGYCGYCGSAIYLTDLHIDHMMPVWRGGPTVPQNLVMTCPPCNLAKGKSTLAEWAERGGPSLKGTA